MTTRSLPLLACAGLLAGGLAGCGGSSSAAPASMPLTRAGASSSPSGSWAPAPTSSSTTRGTTTAPSPGVAHPSSSGAAAARPGSAPTGQRGSAAAGQTAATSTAPGSYTFDTSGTVTQGTQRDAAGTATLTVDPPSGGEQHSAMSSDQGQTEQTVVVRPGGTYLARLIISNPAFSKEFRPAEPVLLLPSPATPGRSWSWTTTSTDGKTTASVTARIAGKQTLTIGGQSVPTVVVASTLKLTGDLTYTGDMQTWVDQADRLTVKDHTKGSGTVSGFAFSTDVTSVARSTRPS